MILSYLKRTTFSHKLYVDETETAIHVEYVLRASELQNGNQKSVSRLNYICRTLPIYETYCSDAIMPKYDMLQPYRMPDDAHKEMPRRNLVIAFHKEFTSLWIKTIQSNYEFDSVSEWIEYWFQVRKCMYECLDKIGVYMYKALAGKRTGSTGTEFDKTRKKMDVMIIVGSISVVYCMCAVNNVRIILRREMLIKKIFWGILLDFLIPVLICFIILSIATGNWEDALIVLQEERRKCIILVLFIIFSNAIIVFAVGYCMVYSFQKDLIEKNRRNKRKEPKKNLSRKYKYRWKNKDYQLIGWLLIIVAIVFYGAYVNWQGIQNAQKQELFLTTRIDNDTYIVVMTDGDEAILEKDRTGKDGKLKICKDKYMKVDCKNLLLEKKKYRRASGDGE